MKNALIIVDMQYDFIYGSLRNEEAIKIIDNVKNQIEKSIANNDDLYFTLDTHYTDYMDTIEGKKLPIIHCQENTKGHEIIDELKQYTKNAKSLVRKNTFGCVDIIPLLKNYDKITLIGVCTDVCVITNALLIKSYYPNTKIEVIKNCCMGITLETHDIALKAMESCHIDII